MIPEGPAQGPGDGGERPRVGVVIVAFNDVAVVERCLEALRKSTGAALDIILADNSLDDRVGRAFSADPAIRFIPMGGNTGFCRASNAGIRKSIDLGTRYTLILNHDTVVEPDCIAMLVARCAAAGDRAVIGGKISYADDPRRIWYAGGRMVGWMGVGVHDRFKEIDDGREEHSREVTYVTGCCMLIPTAAFSRIGLLREDMFMYLDDAEYCLRIRASGFRLLYAPEARILHSVGTGKGFRGYPDYYLYFSVRNKPMVAPNGLYRLYLHAFACLLGFSKLLLYGLAPTVPGRGSKIRALAWGIVDSFGSSERYPRRLPALFESKRSPEG